MKGTTLVVLPTRTEPEGRTWGEEVESRSEATSSGSVRDAVGSPRNEEALLLPVSRGMIGDAVTALDARTRAAKSEISLVICKERLKEDCVVGVSSVECQELARSSYFFFSFFFVLLSKACWFIFICAPRPLKQHNVRWKINCLARAICVIYYFHSKKTFYHFYNLSSLFHSIEPVLIDGMADIFSSSNQQQPAANKDFEQNILFFLICHWVPTASIYLVGARYGVSFFLFSFYGMNKEKKVERRGRARVV